MTNQDKAADILYQRSGVEGHAAQTACQEHAQALHDAGLLAPDLPEPSYVVTECGEESPVWEATTKFRVEADPDNRDFYIFNDYEPDEPLSLAEIRTIIRYLQAAETYMEEA